MSELKRYLTIATVAVIVASALTALTAAAASASPPAYYRCVEKGGTICFVRKPLKAGEKINFTGTGGAEELRFSLANLGCESSTSTGSASGPNELLITITFHGCMQGAGCQSAGQPEHTIVTQPLVGRLFYINKESRQVGMFFTAVKGTALAEFKCGGALLGTNFKLVSGESEKVAKGEGGVCLAGRVAGGLFNEMRTQYGLNIKRGNGVQEVQEVNYEGHKFECNPEIQWNGSHSTATLSEGEDALTFAEELEIQA